MDFYGYHIAHHEGRAAMWRSHGNEAYATGSDRKAARWRQKERAFDLAMRGAYPKAPIEQLMDDHIQRIAGELAVEMFVW